MGLVVFALVTLVEGDFFVSQDSEVRSTYLQSFLSALNQVNS